jgi:hypothetical protein
MADESHPPSPGLGEQEAAAAEDARPQNEAGAAQAEATPDQVESRTKGLLREAIQKVMDEIDHHEKEAQKHLQQAKALRKDLQDSFSFLRGQEGKGKPPQTLNEPKSPDTEVNQRTEAAAPAQKRSPGMSKKKPAGSRGKKG